MFNSYYLILIHFLVIGTLAFVPSKAFKNPLMKLFKFLFPSWKFFDDIKDIPILYYRSGKSSELEKQKWQVLLMRPERRWWHLLINAYGNLALMYNSIIQHFLSDINEEDFREEISVESLPSFLILKSFIERNIPKHHNLFQFKIQDVKLDIDNQEDVFIMTSILERES